MSTHFSNTPCIDWNTVEDYTKYEKIHKAGKNANFRIKGCLIICTLCVEKQKGFRLDYGHRAFDICRL